VNEVRTESINSRIDPKLCPTCPDLLAFVSGLDLWVTCISSGNECRLTHVHKGKSDQWLLHIRNIFKFSPTILVVQLKQLVEFVCVSLFLYMCLDNSFWMKWR